MNRLTGLLLTLAAIALTGVLLVEWQVLGLADDPAAVEDIAAPRRTPHTNPAPPRTAEPDHTAEWVARILARPLFSANRRPAPVGTAAASGSPAATLPRLTGVLITPEGGRAIFAGGDGGKPVVLQAGASLAGFTLRSIAPGAVTVQGPDGESTLHPSFDPNPPPPVAVAGIMQPGLQGVPAPDGAPPQGGLVAARLAAFRQRQMQALPQPGGPPQGGQSLGMPDQPPGAETPPDQAP